MAMITYFINSFGEESARWENHYHPENPRFMQVVRWHGWRHKDGRFTVGYNLSYGAELIIVQRDTGTIEDFKKVCELYNPQEAELTEQDFQEWLKAQST